MKWLLSKNSNSGFTLIEMMVTVAIVSVMIGIAVPNIIDWFPRYRLKSATRDLVSFMQKTKIQAVKTRNSLQIVFDDSVSPGFYYLDLDKDDNWDPGEERVLLGGYQSGVDYGSGSATNNWSGDVISKHITFDPSPHFLFQTMGTSNEQGTIYLENKNADICFAVTVLITGSINVREWTGTASWIE